MPYETDGTEASRPCASETGLQARPGQFVQQANTLRDQAENLLKRAVAHERALGTSWEQIGQALGGVSRSAAQQRFGKSSRYSKQRTLDQLTIQWSRVERLAQDFAALEGLQTLSTTVASTPADTEAAIRNLGHAHSATGTFYVPATSELAQSAAEVERSIDLETGISDPTCGSGAFLAATQQWIASSNPHLDPILRATAIALTALRDADPTATQRAAAGLLAQRESGASAAKVEIEAPPPTLSVEERLSRLELLIGELLENGRVPAQPN